nr:sirohydrochlorin cobaltochelatase [Clostridia bacterium]
MRKFLSILLAALLLLPSLSAAVLAETGPSRVILVASFGTSYNDSRAVTIEAVESAITAAFPDWEVRRAFTAQTIIDKLASRDGLAIDNVDEAMQRLIADGVKEVIVQPTHVMPGYEYTDLIEAVSAYSGSFDKLAIGKPLLYTEEDYEAVIDAVTAEIPEVGSDETAVVFMGHGTEHFANATYSQLEHMMHSEGYENLFVGTVEGYPRIDDVIASVTAFGASKVVLYPLMVVAG